MFVVILNWKQGENDPFTVFNQVLANYFEASGKCTKTVQLTDPDWPNQILTLKGEGIDFVFTWQGLGTRHVVGEQQENFWELAQVPLIALHGDHPCHMPANHALESPFCSHLYTTREFSHYANRHFRRQTRAIFIEPPLLNLDTPLDLNGEEFFVLAKNITPPSETEIKWKAELGKRPLDFLMSVAESLKSLLFHGDRQDIHSVIDARILDQRFEEFYIQLNPVSYHAIHSQLDFYFRNLKAASILELLNDVPLWIFGRGWESYAAAGNPHHHFYKGKNMSDSQQFYYSKYGIVDITPSATGLHDRTLRAIRNQTSYITSGYLPEFLPNMDTYDQLFYDYREKDLREKCESVMTNPEAHRELAMEFGYLYQMQNTPTAFVWKLDSIARSMERG